MAKYYALSASNDAVSTYTSLFNARSAPARIKYLFEETLEATERDYNGWTKDLYKYRAVDLQGNSKPIELRNFIIEDIERDVKYGDGTNRVVVVKERETSKIRRITTFTLEWDFKRFINSTLLELFKELNMSGSFAVYDILQENKSLKEEVAKLKVRLSEVSQNS